MTESKPSAAQFAYESLKDWILSGFLVPGEKIDQDEAARKLNLSRMPIRSGLDRLASEGLVVKTPHRGVMVSPLSDASLNQLFDVRAQMESMAVMITTASAPDSAIDKLYNMLNYQQDVGGTSTSTILEQNRNFHRFIVQLSENDVLLKLFDIVWEQCERYRRIYYQVPNSNDRILKEHRKIVDLIAHRKVQSAADYMVEHTRASQKQLLESMGKQISPLQHRLISLMENPADIYLKAL
ncbi:MAG: GntR family transcriptional regulator [Oscillospiraceae bacterium]|jgi:DNA-binding GntR family transcriptional regulator